MDSFSPAGSARWSIFTAAPHRMYFFFGIVALIVATGLWLADATLLYHSGHTLLAPSVSDIFTHGVIMSLGVFPLFICGFLTTTFPRWMNQAAVGRATYVTSATAMGVGFWVVIAGLVVSDQLVRLGWLLMGSGWAIFLAAMMRVFLSATARPIHACIALPAMFTGDILVLLLAWRSHPMAGQWSLVPFLAIWWVLLPVFLSVAHRMVPFFSKNVIQDYRMHRPPYVLIAMVALCVLHPLLSSSPGILIIVDGALFVCAMGLWLAWQPWKAFENRLLAVLHVGFAWLWIGLLLFTLNDVLRHMGITQLAWRAPLHALTMGLFGSLLLAMTTRVSLGHSGRPLQMSVGLALLFGGIQLATVMRLIAGLPSLDSTVSAILVALSGTLWLAAFVGWAVRFVPIYWQSRVDGASG